jgi:hypothetical protein
LKVSAIHCIWEDRIIRVGDKVDIFKCSDKDNEKIKNYEQKVQDF